MFKSKLRQRFVSRSFLIECLSIHPIYVLLIASPVLLLISQRIDPFIKERLVADRFERHHFFSIHPVCCCSFRIPGYNYHRQHCYTNRTFLKDFNVRPFFTFSFFNSFYIFLLYFVLPSSCPQSLLFFASILLVLAIRLILSAWRFTAALLLRHCMPCRQVFICIHRRFLQYKQSLRKVARDSSCLHPRPFY